MADFYVNGQQQNLSRVGDGTPTRARGTRDGALFVASWTQALILEGVVYTANGGSAATTIAPMATYADTSKTIQADSAAGLAIIPLAAHFTIVATGAAVGYEFVVACAAVSGAGSGTAITARNLRTDVATACGAANVQHTVTSGADNIDGSERYIARAYRTEDLDAAVGPHTTIDWAYNSNGFSPAIVGAGCFALVSVNATSSTGYGWLTWAELASSVIA